MQFQIKTCAVFILISFNGISSFTQAQEIDLDKIRYPIYPGLNRDAPELPSPFTSTDGQEFVVAFTRDEHYAIIPVTLGNDRDICRQLVIDEQDFPGLAKTGLHSENELNRISSITGRPLSEINRLALPNALSQAGFLAADENIISVLKADNRIVKRLGLTHPQLARPLFHVLNMIEADLELDRWNMAKHRWDNILYFYYHDRKVYVEAEDTKGGQESIFNDGIEGGFYIKIWRKYDPDEIDLLKNNYNSLTPDEFERLTISLSSFNTGEIQPQYIMRYGFYEGHTFWRTDPIAIAFIFGLKQLTEIDRIFNHDLYNILTDHYTD